MTAVNRRILVAEDEMMIGMMIEDFLDDLGYGLAGVFASVADCHGALDDGIAFDVALLDCNLSDGPVWPFARRLTEQGVPLLFASGDGGHSIPEDLRAHPSIGKPYLIDALDRALGELLKD